MDLVPEHEREAVFLDRQKVILGQATSRFNFSVTFFKTSIWDETLYKAWSSIVYQLIPNVKALEHQLESLCEICGADEVGRERRERREGGREGGREGEQLTKSEKRPGILLSILFRRLNAARITSICPATPYFLNYHFR